MDSPRNTVDTGDQVKATNGPAVGFRPTNGGIIKVEPPRREDLQPSYAQQLQGDEQESQHGWYGAMSKFALHKHGTP